MSVLGVERSRTASANNYDQAIDLIDKTKPDAEAASFLPTTSEQSLSRQWTKGHFRKELARRKYARWQNDKDLASSAVEASSEDSASEAASQNLAKSAKSSNSRTGRLRDKVPFRTKKPEVENHHKNNTFIDVLYENQRGSFLCGIPLYSSNSLLNFDPAGWQTSTFHDSLVNITNAQLPDPSWQWAWRRWYVDMSYDVDEQGWQYSFSFGNNFAWHGSHPWFHSFVRRRRWLRKREKTNLYHKTAGKGNMKEAHMLTADYFTIHGMKRDRSRDSSTDVTTKNRSSFNGANEATSDYDEDLGEIGDVATLMAALRKSLVDREKIAAVSSFLHHGGDELSYLAETLPTIRDDFVHQTSIRQLQQVLLQALEQAIKARDKEERDDEKQAANKRRLDYLIRAVNTSGVRTNDIGHRSDLKNAVIGSETGPTHHTQALNASKASNPFDNAPKAPEADSQANNIADEIKGISKDAQVSEEPHIGMDVSKDFDRESNEKRELDKGKGKA